MGEQRKSQLLLVRESLEGLPALELPEGYRARSLEAGDEAAWERIIRASFAWEQPFDKGMAGDEAYKPERVWFVVDEHGVPIATASAWYRPQWSEDTGYLHMVGLMPEHAGKRLGYSVSLAALLHMVREGRTKAVLNTDDFRIPAIKTYFNLGFIPELADHDHLQRWTELSRVLNRRIVCVDSDGSKIEIGS
jgi:mycothiol synthase